MSAVPAATASWLSLGTASCVFWSLRPPLGHLDRPVLGPHGLPGDGPRLRRAGGSRGTGRGLLHLVQCGLQRLPVALARVRRPGDGVDVRRSRRHGFLVEPGDGELRLLVAEAALGQPYLHGPVLRLRRVTGHRAGTGPGGAPRSALRRLLPGRRRLRGRARRRRGGRIRRRLQRQQQHDTGHGRGGGQHDPPHGVALPHRFAAPLTSRTTRGGYGGRAHPPRAVPRTPTARTRADRT